jgi:hypothetical protein
VIAALRRSFSDRRIAVVASLAILSLIVLAMIISRVVYTRTFEHTGIAAPLALTVLLTSFLLASYLVFYSFAQMSALIRD